MRWFEEGWPRRKLVGHLIWFLMWVGTTIVGVTLTASAAGHGTHQQLGLPPCPSVYLLGRPCPGCGLTTSWTALLEGNLPLAFSAHPLGPLFYAFFTVSAFANLYGYVKGKRFSSDSPLMNNALWVATVVFIVFGLFRFATTVYNGANNPLAHHVHGEYCTHP